MLKRYFLVLFGGSLFYIERYRMRAVRQLEDTLKKNERRILSSGNFREGALSPSRGKGSSVLDHFPGHPAQPVEQPNW